MTPATGPSPVGPPPQEGLAAQARVMLSGAAKQLIGVLGLMKSLGNPESKAALDALRVLEKVIPDVSEGLQQTELASMLAASQAVKKPGGPMGPTGAPPPRPNVLGSSGPGIGPAMGMGR